ncbi:phosphotransferase [Streptomyces scabiei]|uniref:phosphotransferase n=1 Tax=Streptomyces scabiei TaxID=1930 RepID=UPI0038F67578
MRMGRLLGAGRTADVYELHLDGDESTPPADAGLPPSLEPSAPDGRVAGGGRDRNAGGGGAVGRTGTGDSGCGHADTGDPRGHADTDDTDGPGGRTSPGSHAGSGGSVGHAGTGGHTGRAGLDGHIGTGGAIGHAAPGAARAAAPAGDAPGAPAGTRTPTSPAEATVAWVLRRYRDGWGDAAAEAEVMAYVRRHGYPVPRVRSATRTEMVLERLSGPTMLEALAADLIDPARAGATLARLLHALHALPPRAGAPGSRVLHLDLHPDNVILTPGGPQVIDWSNAEEGPPGLDWGMSAMILAQVAVDAADARAAMARAVLVSLLAHQPAGPSALTEEGLVEAGRRRAATPTMTTREVELIPAAEELARAVVHDGATALRPPRT